jgi:hypothetical protein
MSTFRGSRIGYTKNAGWPTGLPHSLRARYAGPLCVDHIRCLNQTAGVPRGEVERVHDTRELAMAISSRAKLAITRQICAVSSLAIDFIRDHQRVFGEPGDALIHPLKEMLQDDLMWWIRDLIADALTRHVHGASNNSDVLSSDCFDDIVKYAHSGTSGYATPRAASMEYLMPVKLDVGRQTVCTGSPRGYAIKFLGQRYRGGSVNKQGSNNKPVVGVRLVNIGQQHSRKIRESSGAGAPLL